MKKSLLLSVLALSAGATFAQTESYKAISYDATNSTYVASSEFLAVVADSAKGGVATNAADGVSIVKFSTTNIDAEAIGGTTADVVTAEGVQSWKEVKWDFKNQGDIQFGYIVGTGNPVFGYEIEQIWTDGTATENYRQCFNKQNPDYDQVAAYEAKCDTTKKYTVEQYLGTYYYTPDCGQIPAQGLYYKFTAKQNGLLKIYVWSNKGNRNTFLVDAATTKPVQYRVEGYINGQNDADGKKKWLSTAEIENNHAGKVQNGVDTAPYVIGAGNQNFWGVVIYEISANQTVLLFQDSSQIGFQGYDFTVDGKDGIESVKAAQKNGTIYDILGNRVSEMQSGRIYIQNGKKVIVR